MKKPIPFDIWKEQHLDGIQRILEVMEQYLDQSTFPKHMKYYDFYFHEELEENIIRYIYDHSSSKFRG